MSTKPRYQDDRRALDYPCPACNSKVGEPCTASTEDGQRKVSWLHYTRTDLLAKCDHLWEEQASPGEGGKPDDEWRTCVKCNAQEPPIA